jgi:hypothetical protein
MKRDVDDLLPVTNQYLVIETMNERQRSGWQFRLPKTTEFARIYNIATKFGISKKLNVELEELKRQILIEGENAVGDDDLLSIGGRQSHHPYWSKYTQLISLEAANLAPTALRRRVEQLMIGLNFKDRLVVKTLMTLPWFKVSMIEETFSHVLREQFAYSVWSPRILQFVRSYSPLIELGAGNGYNS